MKKLILFLAAVVMSVCASAAPEQKKDEYLTAKDLATLKKIHAWQMQLVKNGKKMPTADRDKLVKDLVAANDTIKNKITKLKKFPNRSQLVDMHYVVANYKNSGNKKYAKLKEDQILANIQKVQLAEMQKGIAADAKKISAKKTAPKKSAAKKAPAKKAPAKKAPAKK